MDQPLYMPIPAVIENIEVETPDIKTFRLRPEKPVPFRAGQFVELFLRYTSELTRLPAFPDGMPRVRSFAVVARHADVPNAERAAQQQRDQLEALRGKLQAGR